MRFTFSGEVMEWTTARPVGVQTPPPQGGDIYVQHRAQTRSEAHPVSHSIETENLAAVASSWPLNSTYCWGTEYVDLYLH